ncbi:MAG: nitrilase-related carbon-nitrogen hydrolase [Phycisphaerae bacterium]
MRIAVGQTPGVRLSEWRDSLAMVDDLVARAAALRAQLLVLPECVWPAYWLASRAAYDAARNSGLPSPQTFLDRIAALARRHALALCAGYVAERDGALFNAAALVDASGARCGAYSKCFLWDFDRRWFTPGDALQPIRTPFGRVGILICADARIPEIAATLVARGAQLLVQPTAWVNGGTADMLWNPQPDFLIAARAAEFNVPIASASKWGREGDTTFVGMSGIRDSRGVLQAQAGATETTVVVADVELSAGGRVRMNDGERAVLLAPSTRGNAGHAHSTEVLTSPPPAVAPAAHDRLRATITRWSADTVRVSGASRSAGSTADGGARDAEAAAGAFDVMLRADDARGAWIDSGGARVAVRHSRDLDRFAPTRVDALRGAELVVAFGEDAPAIALRARAAENRIYVAQVTERELRVFDVRGVPVTPEPRDPPRTPQFRVDLAAAGDKRVAWETDVLAGRTPEIYEF